MKKLSILLTSALLFAGSAIAATPLRISVLGDSYSTFEGCVAPDSNLVWYFTPESQYRQKNNDVTSRDQTWWAQVVSRMGAELVVNNSFSGATICYTGYRDRTGKPADYENRSFVNRTAYLGNPDVILVCGATNDSWCGAPIGDYKYADWTRDDLRTFRPAMACMCSRLKELYPKARIVFMLNSELKPEINETVHTVCSRYGIECIDLHDIEKQMGHPSIKGMKAIANQVVERLTAK
ncbi:MAG: hypothetical protein IKR18_02440 [Bacteroidaceae bacterium]|nr:hypothetical protein [Bacteroidaceae bacterium]